MIWKKNQKYKFALFLLSKNPVLKKILIKDEKSSIESDELNPTTNLHINNKRIKDLESLIEKKFNSNKQEETMTMSRKKSIDDDDESKNSTDSKISSQTDFKDYDDSDEPKQEDKEFDDYEFENDEQADQLPNNNKQKCDEIELKALNVITKLLNTHNILIIQF